MSPPTPSDNDANPTNGLHSPEERSPDLLLRRIAELEARVRELEHYQAIFAQSPVGIAVADAAARLAEANAAFYRISGLSASPGVPLDEILSPQAQEHLRAEVLPATEREGQWRGRLSGRRPDGTAWTVQLNSFQMYDSQADAPRVVAFVRDVSGEEQAQQELRASAAQLRTITDNLPMVLAVIDTQGVFRISTGLALQTLGLQPGQVVGMSAFELYRDVPEIGDDVRRGLAGESFDAVRRVGDRTFETRYSPLYDGAGQLDGTVLVALDITERLQMEVDRLLLQEEVIATQEAALRELSTPLIPVSDDVVIMPLIGSIDSARAQQVIETLLEGVSRAGARMAIVDITGVPVVDTQVANALLRAARSVSLLGAQVMLTGISPEVAQTLVQLGADMSGITTRSTLQSAVAQALRASANGRR